MFFLFTIFTLFTTIASANEPLNVAVSYFANNSNNETLNNLEKGIAEMLITDLSISKDIRLVERERLNDVLKEIDLQKNPYFDNDSAAQLGKGLGAGIIVTGSFMVMNDTIRIDARLINVNTSEVLLAVESNGSQNEFFNVQTQLATKILSGIGSELTVLDQMKIGTNGTKKFEAFNAYSTGLSAMDEGDKVKAKQSFDKALVIDADFKRVSELIQELNQNQQRSANVIQNRLDNLTNNTEPKTCSQLVNDFFILTKEIPSPNYSNIFKDWKYYTIGKDKEKLQKGIQEFYRSPNLPYLQSDNPNFEKLEIYAGVFYQTLPSAFTSDLSNLQCQNAVMLLYSMNFLGHVTPYVIMQLEAKGTDSDPAPGMLFNLRDKKGNILVSNNDLVEHYLYWMNQFFTHPQLQQFPSLDPTHALLTAILQEYEDTFKEFE